MTLDEGVCWSFDKVPSQLDAFYHTITWGDIKHRLTMKAKETELAVHIGPLVALQEVLASAFGGGDNDKGNGALTSTEEIMGALNGN